MNSESGDIESLEIHIRRSSARTKFFVFLIISLVLFRWTFQLTSQEVFWGFKLVNILFLIWLLISSCFATYEKYLETFTKGPAFSFSRHGFIDHRTKTPKIFKWEEVESVAWAARKWSWSRHILQIKLMQPPAIQKYGKYFGYHPYRIGSDSISSSKKRIAGRIKRAVPKDKYKTASTM